MMDDFFGSEEEMDDIVEGNELISRYESMVKYNHPVYLSSDDYELLFMHYTGFYSDTYSEEVDMEMTSKVIHAGILQYPNAPLLNVFWIYFKYLDAKISVTKAVQLLQNIEFPEYERMSQNYHLATVYLKIDALDVARSLYESMLAEANSKEDKKRIYSELIFLFHKPNEVPKLMKHVSEFFKIAPQEESNVLYEFNCNFLFDSEMGVAFFKAYVEKNPFSAKGWQYLGEAYSSQTMFEEAVDSINNAIALSDDTEPLVSLAWIYRSWGKESEALDIYREIISMNPDKKDFYAEIAEVYHILEQYEYAIFYFGLALEHNPSNLSALIGIALSFAEQEQYVDAIRHLRKAITIDFAPIEAWLLMADYLIEIDEDEEALQLYEKVMQSYPQSADVWLAYSNYFALIGDLKKACTILNQGLALMKDNAQLMYRMANYHFLYEDYPAGITYLRGAYSLDEIYLNQFLEYDEQTAALPIVVDTINELMDDKRTEFPFGNLE